MCCFIATVLLCFWFINVIFYYVLQICDCLLLACNRIFLDYKPVTLHLLHVTFTKFT